jgi:hypothetical protein
MAMLPPSEPKPWLRASWWADHVVASFIFSIFNPAVSFFTWPLVLSGGTVLRLVIEKSARGSAVKAPWRGLYC